MNTEPQPVVVTAVFTPKEGKRDTVLELLKPAIAAVHQEDGCLLYAIHEAPGDTLIMIEKWASAEALAAHAAGKAVAELNAAVGEFMEGRAVVTVLNPVPAGTVQQGAL